VTILTDRTIHGDIGLHIVMVTFYLESIKSSLCETYTFKIAILVVFTIVKHILT